MGAPYSFEAPLIRRKGEKPTETPAPDPAPLERSYDDLMRRDSAVTQREQSVRAAEAQMKLVTELQDAAAKGDVATIHARLGVTEAATADTLFGLPDPAEHDADAQQQAALEQRFKEQDQRIEQLTQQNFELAEGQRIAGIVQTGDFAALQAELASNPQGVVREVLQAAAQKMQDSGNTVVPDYADVVRELEERYTDRLVALTQRCLSVTKVRERLGQAKETAAGETDPPPLGTPSSPPQTLTNDLQRVAPTEQRQVLGTDPTSVEARRQKFLSRIPKMLKDERGQE